MLRGYRVRFRVRFYRRGDEGSTVQTNPPCEVRSTRWIGRSVEVVTPDQPPWQVGEAVRLTLEPISRKGKGTLTHASVRSGAFDSNKAT
jgi:hypothetical protein